MKDLPGTYVMLLYNDSHRDVQVGRWRRISLEHGYYLYVGSALGPGGIRARVGRHMRTSKTTRWHIDYLRQAAEVVVVWVHFGKRRLEHDWARALHAASGFGPVRGFGCSDCSCDSHLFYASNKPEDKSMKELLEDELECFTPERFSELRKT